MNVVSFHRMAVAPLRLGVLLLLLLGAQAGRAQPPGKSPAPKLQQQLEERDRLAKQLADLRRAAKYDEAVAVAERSLEMERRAGGETTAGLAEALSRLAEVHELRGDWPGALARRREAMAARERVDGKEHWRTADSRLALAFAQKVAGFGKADQARVAGALRQEQEASRLEDEGKNAETERVALPVLETYRAVLGPETAEVARVWHRIGRARIAQNDARGAKEAMEQTLAIHKKVLPAVHPDLGRSLHNLAVVQNGLGDYAAAKRNYEEALTIWRNALPPDHPNLAACLYNLGLVHSALGDHRSAQKHEEEALAVRRKARPTNDIAIAQTLGNLGNSQCHLCEYASARMSYEEALAISRKVFPNGHSEIARSLNGLGFVQWVQGDYRAAEANHEEALAIRRKALPKDDMLIAESLNNLGAVQVDLREYAAGKASHAEALAIRRKTLPPGHPDIALSLHNLAVVRSKLRDYPAARKGHEDALAMRRKALPPGHPDIAQSLNNLAVVQADMRDYAAAKQSYKEALAIRRKALPNDHPDIARSLDNLGIVQSELGDYAAAKTSYEEALVIRRKALPPGHPNIADNLNNLGNLQRVMGSDAEAKQSHEEALAIRRKALPGDHPDIAQSLGNLGLVLSGVREFAASKASHQEALAIYRKALPGDHPDIARSLNNLGLVQHDLGDYAAAKRSFEEALAIYCKTLPNDHPDIARSLLTLGLLGLASGIDVGDAVPRLAQAADLFQSEQLRLAVAHAEPEQLATASMARLSLHLLIHATLITRADAGVAYDRVVRVKGSVTAQQRWAHEARNTADPETARLLVQLRQVTQQIVGLSLGGRPAHQPSETRDVAALIGTLDAQRDELERQLSEHSEVLRAIQARSGIDGNAVRAALPEGTALIDFVDYVHEEAPAKGEKEPFQEQRIVAFVVRPKQPKVVLVPLGPSQALTELIDRWRTTEGAGKRPPAGAVGPGLELRRRLWEPLTEHLRDVKVVLVSPDGPLNGLPLAALPGSKEGTFLIHLYAFAVVPVPQLLPELLRGEPRPAQEQPSLLLAGGIAFGEESTRDPKAQAGKLPPVPFFRPLPGAESEVNDLRAQFEDIFAGAPAPEVLRKDKATKQAVLGAAPTHRFVHLATHGFFADESEQSAVAVGERAQLLRGGMPLHGEAAGRHPGLLSGLVFAGVNRPDRLPEETILTALEAAELDLAKVELVVLSACETGRGQVAGGEGVLGLQRAFQLAGARSVVASLWRVPDEETHQLMREFYRRVWSDRPLSKAEALRQAQLWMLENWKGRGGLERPAAQGPPPPYVWAAFVLSGDWR